jgi:hypothetical protein
VHDEGFTLAPGLAAVAAANPDRDCIVFGDRRFAFAQTDERAADPPGRSP